MIIFKKIKERLIRRKAERKGVLTLKEVRYVLVGKRFMHYDSITGRTLCDFIITGIEDGIWDTNYLLYKDGKYLISNYDLARLVVSGRSFLATPNGYITASYSIENIDDNVRKMREARKYLIGKKVLYRRCEVVGSVWSAETFIINSLEPSDGDEGIGKITINGEYSLPRITIENLISMGEAEVNNAFSPNLNGGVFELIKIIDN